MLIRWSPSGILPPAHLPGAGILGQPPPSPFDIVFQEGRYHQFGEGLPIENNQVLAQVSDGTVVAPPPRRRNSSLILGTKAVVSAVG